MRKQPTRAVALLMALALIGAACSDSDDSESAPATTAAPAATTAAPAAPAAASSDIELTVVSWGGAYTASQQKAYSEPYTELTGVNFIWDESAGEAVARLRAMNESGNVTWDLVDVVGADGLRLCDEGLAVEIDFDNDLAAGADGSTASADFGDYLIGDCFIPQIIYSTTFGYRTDMVGDTPPTDICALFDTDTYPGMRSIEARPVNNMEWALLCDGVPKADIYDVLGTSAGQDQAIAKLDSIKDSLIFWSAGADTPQLLADGEIVMGSTYNGRLFSAIEEDHQPIAMLWDAQMFDFDGWIIPTGLPPEREQAVRDFLFFATDTQRLADQAKYISYGPARASSAPLVGKHADLGIEMAPHMPTDPANSQNIFVTQYDFWADYRDDIDAKYQSWLAGGTSGASDAPAAASSDIELTVVSWGGAYTASQQKAYSEPYTELTGVNFIWDESAGEAVARLRAMNESGNVTWDLVDVVGADGLRLCDEGLAVEIDFDNDLAAGADGSTASADFGDYLIGDCFIPQIIYSTTFGYRTDMVGDTPPTDICALFDTDTYPGMRSIEARPVNNMEWALLCDGVPKADIYDVLGTSAGQDQAIAKLDSIKDSLIFWSAGADTPQLLADGEIVMGSTYNGRLFSAIEEDHQPIAMLWDAQMFDFDGWIIPTGLPPEREQAVRDFLFFATDTQRLADQAKYISYGPARASSAPLVGKHADLGIEMAPHMPTDPANSQNIFVTQYDFWADYRDDIDAKYQSWLAG